VSIVICQYSIGYWLTQLGSWIFSGECNSCCKHFGWIA